MAQHLRIKTKSQHPSLRQSPRQSLLLPCQWSEVPLGLDQCQKLHHRNARVRARRVHELRRNVRIRTGPRNLKQRQVLGRMCEVPSIPDTGQKQPWETVFY